MESKIITAVNQKGGAGKSTLSMQVAGPMAKDGWRVIVIDAAWRVYSLPDRRMIVSKSWSGTEPLTGDGYDELAAAESRLLGRLATEIAATLR